MRKIILAITVLLVTTMCFAQTPELEKKSLQERYERGEFDHSEYLDYAREWQKLMVEFGGYPEFPIDETTGKIKYEYVFEFPQLVTKDIVFDRVKQWAAINFGRLSYVMHYEDYDNGKIILKGNFKVYYKQDFNFLGFESKNIVQRRCMETYIFTIKENKLKVEIVDLEYQYSTGGYYNTLTNNYVSHYNYEYPIEHYYPVTNAKPKQWNENLYLLLETKEVIDRFTSNLEIYINSVSDDYGF